jgi:hypothetical protein
MEIYVGKVKVLNSLLINCVTELKELHKIVRMRTITRQMIRRTIYAIIKHINCNNWSESREWNCDDMYSCNPKFHLQKTVSFNGHMCCNSRMSI